MAPWVELPGTAFLLQLLALPGEKDQLVIAALATRYDPTASSPAPRRRSATGPPSRSSSVMR